MKLLKELMVLVEARIASRDEVKTAIKIINSFATNENSFHDILIRVMGFTSGVVRPDTNKSEIIDVIPVLNELRKYGLVTMRGPNLYKRGDALSQLMRDHIIKNINSVIGGDATSRGKLSIEQIDRLSNFITGDSDSLGDKIFNAPDIWKSGGNKSGVVKTLVQQRIINLDPNYNDLSADTKEMITKLSQLSDPYTTFVILRHILKLQRHKKGYTSFIDEIENFYKNEKFVDALYGLVEIGVIDSPSGNKINNQEIQNIRNVIEYMKLETVENITPLTKLNAFLPNFGTSATSSSATFHRGINVLLKDQKFVDVIKSKLTPDMYDDILSSDLADLSVVKQKIKQLSNAFHISDLNEFKSKITELVDNRMNHKSDENKLAKDDGRFKEFLQKFTI